MYLIIKMTNDLTKVVFIVLHFISLFRLTEADAEKNTLSSGDPVIQDIVMYKVPVKSNIQNKFELIAID